MTAVEHLVTQREDSLLPEHQRRIRVVGDRVVVTDMVLEFLPQSLVQDVEGYLHPVTAQPLDRLTDSPAACGQTVCTGSSAAKLAEDPERVVRVGVRLPLV